MTLPVRVPTFVHNMIRSDIVNYEDLNIPIVCSNDINGNPSTDLYDNKSQVGFRANRLTIDTDKSVKSLGNSASAGSYITSIGF